MMQVQSLKKEFEKAQAGGYAVPAFNFNDIWEVEGIIQAAEELRSPVILETVMRAMNCLNREVITAMVKEAAKQASVPVFLHLDHCPNVQYCKECVDLGFDMVMIDASALPFEENVSAVKEVVDYAHARGVLVEAELGAVKNNTNSTEEGNHTDDGIIEVAEAVELVKRTQVDILAVGIGTAHGFYKGTPKLRFDRLQEVNEALGIPLVLHGGTGIPVADVQKALTMGICKMNIGANIRYAYISNLMETLATAKPTDHVLDILPKARENIKKTAMEGILSQKADGRV